MKKEELFNIFSRQPKFQQIGQNQYKCCCPAHQDKEPSLCIKFEEDKVLLNDFAGCDISDICRSFGIEPKDLFYNSKEKSVANKYQPLQAEYMYYDEKGKYIYSKLRFATEDGGKKMFCAVNNGSSYDYKSVPKERVLYKLPQLLLAIQNGCKLVYIVEGEKDVETLSKLGMTATTSGSANSWKKEFAQYFKNLNVVILRDNDKSGLDYADAIEKSIHNLCASYKTVITSQKDKGDVTDYIEEGHTKEELLQLIDSVPFIQKANAITKDAPSLKQFNFLSAKDLCEMEIPPIQWVVKNLIPQGLTILAGPPKLGKSWLCLDLCASVATGNPFLGYETEKGTSLYLALEDSLNRLQERMKLVLKGRQIPDNFFITTQSPTINNGLVDMLQSFIDTHKDTKLIVIDTFQKIRDGMKKSETLYQGDYRETSILKKFADDNGIALVLVHHLRKMDDVADPFSRISGSNGITGAADTAIVLSKAKRTDDNAVMYSTGRDIEQKEVVISFNKNSLRWEILGDIGEVAYKESPVVKFLKTKRGYEGKTSDLWMEYNEQADEVITQTMFGSEINKFTTQLRQNGLIVKKIRKTQGFYISIR